MVLRALFFTCFMNAQKSRLYDLWNLVEFLYSVNIGLVLDCAF